MKTNIDYFELSKNNLEPMFDPFYIREKLVIPKSAKDTNILVEKNMQLVKLVSAFEVLTGKGENRASLAIKGIVDDVISILDRTPGINLSSFVTFFCTYNANYVVYKKLRGAEKFEFVYEMLAYYSKQRHSMYLEHGYSNAMLQTVSDSHAHKAKSKSGINKIEEMLAPYGITRLCFENFKDADNYYFLPDKGDEILFESFKAKLPLKYTYCSLEQDKRPDCVVKMRGEYFIIEMKNMKEEGGGQNKQIAEVVNFIRFPEDDIHVHYMTFLDGVYFNQFVTDKQPKILRQYDDALRCLHEVHQNYFVNTFGFAEMLKDLNQV